MYKRQDLDLEFLISAGLGLGLGLEGSGLELGLGLGYWWTCYKSGIAHGLAYTCAVFVRLRHSFKRRLNV